MKKVIKVAAVILLICVISFTAFFGYSLYKLRHQKDTHNLAQLISKESNKYLKAKKGVGLAVGVYQNGKVYTSGFGYADMNTQKPVDTNTIFELGSITKVFSAELTQILVDKGELKWSDNICDLLPAGYKPEVNDGTTLLSLATHTSGFPRIPKPLLESIKNECNPYTDFNRSDYEKCIRDLVGKKKPDSNNYSYSNMGYGVLANCLETKTGLSYDTLLNNEIFSVLGMKNTGMNTNDTLNFATGYDETQKPTCHWDLPVMYGCGGLLSNLKDMMPFMEANLAPNPLYKSFAETQKQIYKGTNGGIGKGWHQDKINGMVIGHDIVWKNGGTGGFRTYIGLVPESNVGVVVLSNQAGNDLDKLALILLTLASHVSLQ